MIADQQPRAPNSSAPVDDAVDPFDADFEKIIFDVTEPIPPTRLVDTVPNFTPWAPPDLPLELQLDHLIGGGVLDILAPPGESNDARSLDRKLRRLPKVLRRPIQSLHTTWHREDLFALVEKEVKIRAGLAKFEEITVPGEIFTQAYLPEIHRRSALLAAAGDRAFVRVLEKEALRLKADGHVVRLFGSLPRSLPALPACPLPHGGVWGAESWLGIANSSMPESMPEEVVAALAQRTLLRCPVRGGKRNSTTRRLLHWGALHSTLAAALIAAAPDRRDLAVYEVDTVGQTPALPCVRWRSAALPTEGSFDLALVHLPPPGVDANNIRNRYKDLALPTGTEVHIEDIGRLGPRKWRRRAHKLLREVLCRVLPEGEVALVLPTSVRTVVQRGRYAEWGYAPSAELTDGITELLAQEGWQTVRDLEIVELNPQPQPYFVTRRCTWRFMLATRSQTGSLLNQASNVEDVFL